MGIDTLEGLQKFVEEMREKFKAFAEKIGLLETSKAEGDAKIETLTVDLAESKATNVQFTEKLKNIQALVKAKDAILLSNDSAEVQDYKMGKMVQLLLRKHFGNVEPGDAKTMLQLGAIPTQNSSRFDAGPVRIAKGYKDLRTAQIKAYGTKAAISSDPLTSDDSDEGNFFGSYLVPVDTDASLLRIAADMSTMMPLVTNRPVRGITTYLPTTTDAFAFVAVTDQETAKTEETLTFSRATLTAITYALWIAITEEVDEDSLISLGALIRTMTTEAWAAKFDSLCLENATYGVIGTSGVNELVMGAGNTGFGNITVTDLDGMIAKLTTRAKRRGARFFFHPTVWDEVVTLTDANGRYIVRERVSEAAPLMVRGYPVSITDGLPGLSDSAISTSFAVFGNPSYIVHGARTGFEFRIFDQMESTMKYDQIVLRARIRSAFVLWAATAWVKLTTAAA